jgi:hypothetical protein
MREAWFGALLILAGCGGREETPFVCDDLAFDETVVLGRRPAQPGVDRSPLVAGDEVQTYRVTPMQRESDEELAYRAAVLGCMLGLDEIPGSIRTWAEKTEGWTSPYVIGGRVEGPWERFEADGVELYLLPPRSEEGRGVLIGRRDEDVATLDALPDDVGFPIALGLMQTLRARGLVGDDSFSVPPSYEERLPLLPSRAEARFEFHPRLGGFRLTYGGSVAISLGNDGSPVYVAMSDSHIDEASVLTLHRDELEAADLVRQAVPEDGVIDREETMHSNGSAGADVVRWLLYRTPNDAHDLLWLSLTAESDIPGKAVGDSAFDTSGWL